MNINYTDRIPNNVNLAGDRTLQRALEHWQPRFLDWWREMGPSDFAANDVYLRTAIGVDVEGWASYGEVRMPDYRWGIFLADAIPDRTIGFGDLLREHCGNPVPSHQASHWGVALNPAQKFVFRSCQHGSLLEMFRRVPISAET